MKRKQKTRAKLEPIQKDIAYANVKQSQERCLVCIILCQPILLIKMLYCIYLLTGAVPQQENGTRIAEGGFCPPIPSSQRLTVSCVNPDTKFHVPCTEPVPVGTIVRFECPQYYHTTGLPEDRISVCNETEQWDKKPLNCEPGRKVR